jgi:hypothetical protein
MPARLNSTFVTQPTQDIDHGLQRRLDSRDSG